MTSSGNNSATSSMVLAEHVATARAAIELEIQKLTDDKSEHRLVNHTLETLVEPAVFDAILDSGVYPWTGYRITCNYLTKRVSLRHMSSALDGTVIKFIEKALHQQLKQLGLVNTDQYVMHTNLRYRWQHPDGNAGMMVPDLGVHAIVESLASNPKVPLPTPELVGPTCVLEVTYGETREHAIEKAGIWMHAAPMLQSVIIISICKLLIQLPGSPHSARPLLVETFQRAENDLRSTAWIDLMDYTIAPALPLRLTLDDILGDHAPVTLRSRVIEVDLEACRKDALSLAIWWK